MVDMSKYAGVQNPQLYQQILDEERKRQSRGSPPYNTGGYSPPSLSNSSNGQNQNTPQLTGKPHPTNSYSNPYEDNYTYGQGYKPVRSPKPGVYVDQSNGEVNFTEIFKGVGDAAIDYAQTGEMKPYVIKASKPAEQEESPVQDEWNFEPIPKNEDGTYEAPMDWLFPKESSEVFSPKNQAVGFALREDSIAADAYTQKGWGNEIIDMNTAKDYYDGLLTPEEIAALSPEQLEAIRTWCQMEETRRDMFEQLLNYGQRGNYTWENLFTHMKKMTQVIKYDPAIFREGAYGIYKFVRGGAGFALSPLEWSLGSGMDTIATICEQSGLTEEAEWFRQQAINIKTEAGMEWLDDKMAEWLNIRKGSVQEGDMIEQFGRKATRAGTTLLLNLSGAPSWVANLLGAADTAIQATASVYEETGDAKVASAYGNAMGALDFGIGTLLDLFKLGKGADNAITKHITDMLSGSVAGKALMVLLNIKSGALLNTLGYGIYRTIEHYVLGDEKPVSREEIADTFAKFLEVGFVYEIISLVLGGYDNPQDSKNGNTAQAEDAGTQPKNAQSDAEQSALPPGSQQNPNHPAGTDNAPDDAPPWMSGGATTEDMDGMTPRQEKEFVQGLGGQGDANQDPTSHIPASGQSAGKGTSVEMPDAGPGYESNTAEDLGDVIELETSDKTQAQTGDYGGQENKTSTDSSSENYLRDKTSSSGNRDIVGSDFDDIRPTQTVVNSEKVAEYIKRLEAGEKLPPIEVVEIPGKGRYIIEGHHRYVASQQAGMPIEIIVVEGSGPIGMPNWEDVQWKEYIDESQFWDD